MNLVIIQQIVSVLMQAVEAGIKYGPAIIADLKLAYSLATSGTTLTEDQIAQANQYVINAHTALQAQLALDTEEDGA